MSDNLAEKCQYLDALVSRVINQSNSAITEAKEALKANRGRPTSVNHLGSDLEAADLREVENLLRGKSPGIDSYREAQLRELAFWRWVAFEGYAGKDPRLFPLAQEQLMVGTFYRTQWTLAEFAGGKVLELGCGPLGMIEYVPAATRVAFDPLNPYYSRLFSRYRSPGIQYISTRPQFESLDSDFDLAICHNVIDHTDDPAYWFDGLFKHLKPGGRFIFQVNLSRPGVAQSEEHRRMHPSPFVEQQILAWLKTKSDDFNFELNDQKTVDGEFPFFAFGAKSRDEKVDYAKPQI